APPIDQTVTTNLFAATSFLVSGASPIQTGVAPGTIEPKRVAVLRGLVTDRDGNPVSGVQVSVKDQPQLGQTLTRLDGAFDLVVNGGGFLTIDFAKAGFLPVQRTLDVPWQDYRFVPDVAMVALDPDVTAIDTAAATGFQVARGSAQTDSDGTRRATVLFPPGVTAELELPDGTTQPAATLHVRATEYTVGPRGENAMPAALPCMSAYTYAVELSADEAIAVNARRVTFSSSVIGYVENFLGLPVGLQVPSGTYNRDLAGWETDADGRIVKVVGIASGKAELDVTGDDVADDVSSLGVTDQELAVLASLYAVG